MKFKMAICLAALGLAVFGQSNRVKKYYLSEVQSNGADTALYLVNPGDAATNVDIFGFSADGMTVRQADGVTSIGARSKIMMPVSQLWPGVTDVDWIQVGSDTEIYVIGELWGDGTRSAYWAASTLDDGAYMPHVAKNTATFSTTLSAINGTSAGMQTALRPRPSGSIKVVSEHGGAYAKAKHDVLDYWTDLASINWVEMESNARGLAAMEYFDYINGAKRRASLGLDTQLGKTLRFLHVATDTGTFWTGMVYINVGGAAANVTETYYNASGAVLSSRDVTMTTNEKVTLLFDANTMDPVPAGTAWVKVESDQDLVGYELFGSANGSADDFFAGLQGNYKSNQVLDYAHYQASASEWIGYVALNLGDSAADITFTLYNANGAEVTQTTITGVQPNQKVTRVGADLFGSAQGAWVRAESSGSSWAGFMLWGDLNNPRTFLSGVNAALRAKSGGGPGPVERTIVEEVENNNSYGSAQVLTSVGGAWNINVVGELAQSDAGTQVNNYGSGSDDIEDVYKITLSQPTKLIIAVSPEVSLADIDMFVLSNERANGNWFDVDPHTDPTIHYSAAGGGYESVAAVFPAGDYYIMVSLFEGDAVSRTNYGLLVSGFPLMLETFDSSSDLDGYTKAVWIGQDDSDQQANWRFSDELAGSTKYGSSALMEAPPNGAMEISGLQSPDVEVPDNGVTVVDFTFLTFQETATGEGEGLALYLKFPEAENLEFVTGLAWNADATGTPFDFGGSQFNSVSQGWFRWVSAVQAIGGSSFEYTLEPGRPVALVVLCNSTKTFWLLDNVQVYNIQTSPNSKRDGKAELIFAPATRKPKLDAAGNLIRTH
ncbi:MAG: hypothetical protein KDC35_06255 [Acidobacteria bacterium]|nr:hypothetical protein [Acidobacteriota bacterium]